MKYIAVPEEIREEERGVLISLNEGVKGIVAITSGIHKSGSGDR